MLVRCNAIEQFHLSKFSKIHRWTCVLMRSAATIADIEIVSTCIEFSVSLKSKISRLYLFKNQDNYQKMFIVKFFGLPQIIRLSNHMGKFQLLYDQYSIVYWSISISYALLMVHKTQEMKLTITLYDVYMQKLIPDHPLCAKPMHCIVSHLTPPFLPWPRPSTNQNTQQ